MAVIKVTIDNNKYIVLVIKVNDESPSPLKLIIAIELKKVELNR